MEYTKLQLERIRNAGSHYIATLEFELSDDDYELIKNLVTDFEKKLNDRSDVMLKRCNYCYKNFVKNLGDPATYCASCRERLKNENNL